ncbi:hypothetical protein U9M48_010708 [Paspalum notatum var. saurae]|uniref:Formin-like protein 18 n=1 Tax=Paspalum notatum var. saurae TaxID=547442 RepID=A0AAQ3SUP7_PASNO
MGLRNTVPVWAHALPLAGVAVAAPPPTRKEGEPHANNQPRSPQWARSRPGHSAAARSDPARRQLESPRPPPPRQPPNPCSLTDAWATPPLGPLASDRGPARKWGARGLVSHSHGTPGSRLATRESSHPTAPPPPFLTLRRFLYHHHHPPSSSLSPSSPPIGRHPSLALRPSPPIRADQSEFRGSPGFGGGATPMDPCPFVRVLVGNLALRMPVAPPAAGFGAGVHPSTSPCYCKIRLGKMPAQSAPASGALAAAFHLSKADLEWLNGKPSLFSSRGEASLKVSVYAGRKGSTCGVSSGRLLGKATIPLDLKGAEAKPAVLHSGWISIGGKRGGKGAGSGAAAELSLTVRAEPDPRFVFEFDGEPECSPQVLQVRGSMKQPMFTCRFGCRSNSDLRRPAAEGGGKERKGWSVTVHDLSGSPVAMASMVTPFVPSPSSDRVSRSNPGAWLILRPAGDGAWEPWARLECWRERGGAGSSDSLGYRFELLLPGADHAVPLADSSIPSSKGGKFAIDLTAAQPLSRGGTPGCSPRGSGDLSSWPLGNYRGFVMSAAVQGEGRCSKPTVEVGVAHVGCAEDAAAFVALAAAVDLSMDACRLFSHRLRKELSHPQADLLR